MNGLLKGWIFFFESHSHFSKIFQFLNLQCWQNQIVVGQNFFPIFSLLKGIGYDCYIDFISTDNTFSSSKKLSTEGRSFNKSAKGKVFWEFELLEKTRPVSDYLRAVVVCDVKNKSSGPGIA